MRIPETPATSSAVAGIHRILEGVQYYYDYSDNQTTTDYLKALGTQTPPGVTIDVAPVAYQIDQHGQQIPLHRADIDLGTDGLTVYGLGGVHSNELGWRLCFMDTAQAAVEAPEVLRAIGIGRVVLLEGERVVSDRNTWHLNCYKPPLGRYLANAQRGIEMVEWGYPVNYRGYRFASKAAGCLASQAVIKEIKPDLVVPYHNSAISGPYALVDNMPSGFPAALSSALSIYGMLPHGTTDIQPAQQLARGVFRLSSWQELYDHYAALGQTDNMFMNCGDSTIGYANAQAQAEGRSLPAGLMVEAPYYVAQNLALGLTPTNISCHQLHWQHIQKLTGILNTTELYLPKILDYVPDSNHLVQEIRTRIDSWQAELNALLQSRPEGPDYTLTTGELARRTGMMFYALMPLGLLGQLADAADLPYRRTIQDQLRRDAYIVQKRMQLRFDNPRRMTRVQLGTTLMAAQALSNS